MTIREQIEAARRAEFISVEQVSLLTSLHPITIYKKAKRGLIPGMRRDGRFISFRRVDVLQWYANCRFRAKPVPRS